MRSLVRRLSPAVQWMLAVALLAAAGVVGTSAVRELREVTRIGEGTVMSLDDTAPPKSVPPGAVRLPVLLLKGEVRVRIGDSASQVATLLGRGAEVGRHDVERTVDGDRLVRFYEYGDTRFLLVFSLVESPQDPVVADIYRH